jgi:hypothetical protein
VKAAMFLLALSASAQYRANYPYSVLPGGLEGVAVEQVTDPVAREAWNNVKALSPACLRAGAYFLQYRRGADVGWTATSRKIAAGEPVLADQQGHILRLRCGNGISKAPRLPLVPFAPPGPVEEERRIVEWLEPPGMVPTAPLISLVVDLPPYPHVMEPPPPDTRVGGFLVPIVPRWWGHGPLVPVVDDSRPLPGTAPEPVSWVMVGLGLAMLTANRRSK